MSRESLLQRVGAVDWARTRSDGEDSSYVPDAFRRLIDARTDSEAETAFRRFDNSVVTQGFLHEAAEKLVPCLLEALSFELSGPARHQVVELLTEISLGYTSSAEQAEGNTQLAEACRAAIRQGLDQIYGLLTDTDARVRRAALYILNRVELDRPRLAAVAEPLAKSDQDEGVRSLAADQLTTR